MGKARSHTATAIVIVGAVNLFGLGLLGWGVFSFWRNQSFIDRALPALGEVIAYDRPAGAAAGAAPLTPVVRYSVSRTDIRNLRPQFGLLGQGYAVGQKLTVLYDPNDPQTARIDDFWQLWFTPLLCGCLGLAMVSLPSFALAVALAGNRRDRRV